RLRHRHRQEERGPARFRRNIGNWLGLHVLDDVDAVIGNERLVYRESDAFFLARNHFHRPGVGADTWAVEVIPGEEEGIAFPVHKTLITDNGIHIIENVQTQPIADVAAKSGRATFFLSMTVPKAVGLTGTFVNIEAIQDR